MSVKHSILHFLDKQQGATAAQLQLKPEELMQSNHLEALHAQLHEIYHGKTEKGYGAFRQPASTFQEKMTQWLAGDLSFIAFSHQIAELFKTYVEKETLAVGGHLLLSFEQRGMSDYLWIVILHQDRGLSVNAALELTSTEYLNLQNLHLAAKINLVEWQNNDKASRYISFAKGKTASKVTEYFKNVIGCEETTDPESQTQSLVQGFQQYCHSQALDANQANEYSEKLYDYCKGQADTGGAVHMDDVAKLLDTPDMDGFAESFDQRSIIPHRRSLKQFVQLQGNMNGLSISFQKKLLGSSVFFDADTGVLTITDVPSQLREQLVEMQTV